MGFVRRRNYAENTIDGVVDCVKDNIRSEVENMKIVNRSDDESAAFAYLWLMLRSKTELIIEGECYVGITANPVQSLTAHGIDIHAENTFFCMDIPAASAEDCKKALADLDGYEAKTNPDNDYLDNTYSQLYVYIYRISDDTNEKIDISGFTPLKKIPEKPVIVELSFTDGSYNKKYYDDPEQDQFEDLISEIIDYAAANQIAKFCIVHRELNKLYAEFGENCCVINYDNGTSQVGGYQSYRSGEKSRKKVQLFINEYPEYMLCRDFSILENILSYFLIKGKKPGKRQNIKWVNMKE